MNPMDNDITSIVGKVKDIAADAQAMAGKLSGLLTPEILASLPPEARAEVERGMKDIAKQTPEINKAMEKFNDANKVNESIKY